jgi:molecular chaperone GrpE
VSKNEQDHIEELLDEEEMDEAPIEPTLEDRLKEAEDKVLRMAAESDNFRTRIIRETDDKIKYANQSLLEKFLPVIDNFDLALQHLDTTNPDALAEGIRLNHKVLLDTLEKAGLSVISGQRGDVFDPSIHEAILLANDATLPAGAITMVVQNGYRMGDRVVRPAKVQVNKI